MHENRNKRFQSGDNCVEAGWYEFDGYVAGPPEPLPTLTDWEISLGLGDVFPLIRNPNRACYWRLADGVPLQAQHASEPALRGK